MTTTDLSTLDVRDILKAGGEPFSQIMQAVEALTPGQCPASASDFQAGSLIQRHGAARLRPCRARDPRRRLGGDFHPGESGRTNGQRDEREAMSHRVGALADGEALEIVTDHEPTLLYRALGRRGHRYVAESRSGSCHTVIHRIDGKSAP